MSDVPSEVSYGDPDDLRPAPSVTPTYHLKIDGEVIGYSTELTMSTEDPDTGKAEIDFRDFKRPATMSFDASLSPEVIATVYGIPPSILEGPGPVMPPPVKPPADPKAIVDVLDEVFAIGEEIKRRLADRGWTYEAAEEIAVNYVNASIENGIRLT